MGACCSAPPITEEQRPQIEAIKVELADKGLPIGDWMAYRCLTEAGYKENLLKQCEQMQNFQVCGVCVCVCLSVCISVCLDTFVPARVLEFYCRGKFTPYVLSLALSHKTTTVAAHTHIHT
jgi:hypothetical protein